MNKAVPAVPCATQLRSRTGNDERQVHLTVSASRCGGARQVTPPALMILPSLSKISPICALGDDQRRAHGERVADGAEHDAVLVEAAFQRLEAALADGVGLAGEIDADGQADRADVEHVRQALERPSPPAPRPARACRARSNRSFVAIEIERGEARRAGERMRRIGVAVEQLDDVLGALHEGVVDALAHDARRPSAPRRR